MKAIISASGITEHNAARTNNLKFTESPLNAAYMTAGTAKCENADAISAGPGELLSGIDYHILLDS